MTCWGSAPTPEDLTPSAGRCSAIPRAASCACSSARRCRRTGCTRSASTRAEHERIAQWWADLLGGRFVTDVEEGYSCGRGDPGRAVRGVVFAPVPEPKTVKNRIHWDVDTDDVDALVAAGAAVLRERGRRDRRGRPGRPRGQRVLRVHRLRARRLTPAPGRRRRDLAARPRRQQAGQQARRLRRRAPPARAGPTAAPSAPSTAGRDQRLHGDPGERRASSVPSTVATTESSTASTASIRRS